MDKSLKDRILELFKIGYTYNKISKELGCSKGTISYHLKNLVDKKKDEKKTLLKEIELNLPKDREIFNNQYGELLSHSEKRYFYNKYYKKENKGTKKGNIPYDYYRNRRFEIKKFLVDYKGGKCEICGYSKSLRALQFHHTNPEEKDFNVGGVIKIDDDVIKELEKCILVCANCHSEIHDKNLNG